MWIAVPAEGRGRVRNFVLLLERAAPVAQLDRALDSGSKGWGFEPLRAHKGQG